jgi:hypothetical protein
MDRRLLDAYLDYSGELARAGIIDDSLTENIDDDRPLDDRIADILRAVGRLPAGWGQDQVWRPLPRLQAVTGALTSESAVSGKYASLIRVQLARAS